MSAGSGHALFLDIDGTLVGFSPTPESVVLDPAILDLMTDLRAVHGEAVAAITGRPLADVDRLFQGRLTAAAGLHGDETRGADGAMIATAHRLDPDVVERARAMVAGSRVALEVKTNGVALHYRRAPDAAEDARHLAAAVADLIGPSHAAMPGNMVIEIKPRSVNKGKAIGALMRAPPFRDRVPVFLGDDVTDEYGFDAVNAAGGLSILVGDRLDTRATARLPDIPACLSWLRDMADAGGAPNVDRLTPVVGEKLTG